MKIIIEGPQGCGKSSFIHRHVVAMLRQAGRGASFLFDGETEPTMHLSGPDEIQVIERQTDA
jgi:ABC-type iron transport system FetAB ATPase subunit